MLQQTPVVAGRAGLASWMARWPTPGRSWPPSRPARRSAPGAGSAIRAGRCACTRARSAIVERHGGEVPDDVDAAAGAARHRDVHGPGGGRVRLRPAPPGRGHQRPPGGGPGRRRARPTAAPRPPPPTWPRSPRCCCPTDHERGGPGQRRVHGAGRGGLHRPRAALRRVPAARRLRLADRRRASRPSGPSRRTQRYAGTDRQVRGLLLAVLRARDGPVPAARLDVVWDDAVQRGRALAGLLDDGLVRERGGDVHVAGVSAGVAAGSSSFSHTFRDSLHARSSIGSRRAHPSCQGPPGRRRVCRGACRRRDARGLRCFLTRRSQVDRRPARRTAASPSPSPDSPSNLPRRPLRRRPHRLRRSRPSRDAVDRRGAAGRHQLRRPAAEVRPPAARPTRSTCPRARPCSTTPASRPSSRSRSSPSTTAR